MNKPINLIPLSQVRGFANNPEPPRDWVDAKERDIEREATSILADPRELEDAVDRHVGIRLSTDEQLHWNALMEVCARVFSRPDSERLMGDHKKISEALEQCIRDCVWRQAEAEVEDQMMPDDYCGDFDSLPF